MSFIGEQPHQEGVHGGSQRADSQHINSQLNQFYSSNQQSEMAGSSMHKGNSVSTLDEKNGEVHANN